MYYLEGKKHARSVQEEYGGGGGQFEDGEDALRYEYVGDDQHVFYMMLILRSSRDGS